jgi:hypothetical protein
MSNIKLDETIFSLPRLLMTTLWPSFIMACVSTALLFSLVDADAIINSHNAELGNEVIYSIAFFIFWIIGALTSGLTALLMCKSR